MIIRIIKNIFLVSFLIIGTLLAEDKILSLPKVTVEYVTNTVFQTGILDIRTRTFHAKNLKRIDAVVFGIFDLLNDIGIEYTKGNPRGAKYARYKIPVDVTAAGVYAIDGIWQDIKDKSGLKKDCDVGRSLGYVGKSIIHPDQIETVHKIYHPNKNEIRWAKLVMKTYNSSTKKGKGATVVDGKMIDEVHYKRAKALLEI